MHVKIMDIYSPFRPVLHVLKLEWISQRKMPSPDCGPHGNDNATPHGAWSHVRSAEYAVTRRICQF